eukprot:Skav227309  [mRNA]  locus=scaffold2645:377390:384283:- [translate_table: standard]
MPRENSIHQGLIVCTKEYGAFVQLGKGDKYKDGFLHIGCLPNPPGVERVEVVNSVVREGDKVWVKVRDVDAPRFVHQKDGHDLDPFNGRGRAASAVINAQKEGFGDEVAKKREQDGWPRGGPRVLHGASRGCDPEDKKAKKMKKRLEKQKQKLEKLKHGSLGKESSKEKKKEKEKEKEKDKEKDKEKEKEKEKDEDISDKKKESKEKAKDKGREQEKEKAKDKPREKEKAKEKPKDRDSDEDSQSLLCFGDDIFIHPCEH